MFHAVTCVQFNSENYSASSLDLSLNVTLTLSGLTQSEPFDVFVIAKDTLSADCMLCTYVTWLCTYMALYFITTAKDFTPGWYKATFEPGNIITTAKKIPILSRELDVSIEQFDLELYIPGASYNIGIQAGVLNTAIVNIKDGL